ncbi:transcriptional regulator, AraC family with amidase-like domain [Shimia gijangensis]|uniref:Transcriptional regulator, AraC family with amidase-like domain n=1 Tax=Shimia gijangensis TaxID=1470563 RepID=A0A1M6LM27_9RHOB|nr:GlxA family transcriptional regulator [Shimia gijangensis]SHJ72112.1 transcriptional regulator, AraC family with amidase-like domain [Shimia gijangensis]
MKTAKNIFLPNDQALNTAVLVLDQCNTLSFAAAVDPMRAANRRAGRPLFNWRFYTAVGDSAHLTSGLKIDGPPIAQLVSCDLLLVIAGFDLEEHATPRLLASLRRIHAMGSAIAALDGAPWLLAQAGLLDGHNATTHWEDLENFATRFPAVLTHRDRFVIDPPFATSGGAAPGIDMMLHLISTRFGTSLATRVASAFVYDPLPPGQQGPGPGAAPRQVRRNPQIVRALDLMETHIDDPLSIPEIAQRLSVSTRSLEQRFKTHLGQSPHSYYLQLRLNEAHRLAIDTSMSVQNLAAATGFGSQASFARAFRQAHGLSVRALRRQLGR